MLKLSPCVFCGAGEGTGPIMVLFFFFLIESQEVCCGGDPFLPSFPALCHCSRFFFFFFFGGGAEAVKMGGDRCLFLIVLWVARLFFRRCYGRQTSNWGLGPYLDLLKAKYKQQTTWPSLCQKDVETNPKTKENR